VATGEENPDFITLPPGLADSATHRLPVPRPETPKPRDEIVFVPTVPFIPPISEETRVEQTQVEETRAEPRHSAPGWRLEVPGNGSVVVDSALFVGRNPAATEGFPDAAVLAVDDADKTLSKTHALFEADAGELWVTDLHSTNGVIIALPDDSENLLEGGVRTSVPDGATVVLGSVPITVTRS
jgi:pSer/pThr/pTyr-binding forkhead associated (FHA) protein